MSLKLQDITVRYGKSTPVLRGVDLEVQRGELVGLLGPNGSGKSTLLKTIAGVIPRHAGTATWEGETDLDSLSRRDLAKLVGYVPQSIEPTFALDVREAVLLGRTPHFTTRPRAEDWDAVERALQLLDLESLAERAITEISGGQAQRVLIARAVAQATSVLLLDEPTSALDIRYQWQTLSLARRIAHRDGVAAVIAIHDLNQAARFCDRVVVLRGGELLASGLPQDVYTPELIERVYGVKVELTAHRGYVEVHPLLDEDEDEDDITLASADSGQGAVLRAVG